MYAGVYCIAKWHTCVAFLTHCDSTFGLFDFCSLSLVDRSQEVVLANMALENGVHEAGWAAVHFASIEHASIALERYLVWSLASQLTITFHTYHQVLHLLNRGDVPYHIFCDMLSRPVVCPLPTCSMMGCVYFPVNKCVTGTL